MEMSYWFILMSGFTFGAVVRSCAREVLTGVLGIKGVLMLLGEKRGKISS